MSKHIDEIRSALREAMRAYHDSTLWGQESVEYDGSGPTYWQEIERAMVEAEHYIKTLEARVAALDAQ